MALRELILKSAIALILLGIFFLLGILWLVVSAIVLLSNDLNQALWDKMLNTAVISDPDQRFRPVPQPRYVSGS